MNNDKGTVEEVHHMYISKMLDEILDQVRITNGRLRTAEKAIAVLQLGYILGAMVLGGFLNNLMNKLP